MIEQLKRNLSQRIDFRVQKWLCKWVEKVIKKTGGKNAENAFVEYSSRFFTEKCVVSKKNLGFLVNNQLVKEKCRYSSMTMCFT